MGDAVPALLFRSAVNTAPCGSPRTETLSSGRYELVDVACRVCDAALGWRYLRADAGAGGTLPRHGCAAFARTPHCVVISSPARATG